MVGFKSITGTGLAAGAWALATLPSVAAAPPVVNYLMPAGAARGSSVEVQAGGDFSSWPVSCQASDPGIQVEALGEKGKFKLTAAESLSPGVYWLRCFSPEGASSPRPFVIGTLPELAEVEPNESPEKPQAVADRVTINGRLARGGDVDGFALTLQKGQTLVASLQGNSDLGSPMDAVMQVCWLAPAAAGTGPVDAFVMQQNDDTVGIDPRIVYPVPRDGTYVVRVFAFPKVPNSTIGFSGGNDFIYRLTLTTGGFVDHARPLAVPADSSAVVELGGWNIPDELRQVSIPARPAGEVWNVFHADMASCAPIAVVRSTVVDYRPATGASPPVLPIPVSVTGLLQARHQRDIFVLPATKGKKYRLRVESRKLGYDADPALRITDAAGKRLEEADDSDGGRDPSLSFTAPADGEYRVEVYDIHGLGGPRFAYRLSIEDAAPDFALALAADSVVVAAGKSVEIPVTIERRDGFEAPISIRAVGLPESVTAIPVVSEKSGASAKSVKIQLTATEAGKPFQGPISIQGTVEAATPPLQRTAEYTLKDLEVRRSDLWLTVSPAAKP